MMAGRRGTKLGSVGIAATALALSMASGAQASEGGTSLYLLGSGGPGAGEAAPVKGLFFGNTVYYYGANPKVNRQFVVGGNIVAGMDADIVADFMAVAWVPTQDFLGGTLTLGALLPFGTPIIDVNAIITGPLGRQISVTRHDSATIAGDPLAEVALGWKTGKLHIQATTLLNIPVGNYRRDKLANLSFNRWALDASLALSWIDPESGWDLTGKGGVTFNGENKITDYNTGTEAHFEASAEKMLSKAFSLGVQSYYFRQLTADTGAGARLGSYKGEVAALGVTAAYRTVLGRSPTTFRIQAFKEFEATNRLEGKSVMLTMSLPLKMILPPHAAE